MTEPGLAAAAAPEDPDDVLACGRPLAALVDQVDAGVLEPADEHQAGCVSCRGALRDAATSSRALDLLRVERPPVPAGLVDRVLRQVRLSQPLRSPVELAGVGSLQLAGRVRVQQHVLAELARTAAAGQRGVTVTRSSATGTETGLRVVLGLLVDGRTPLPALAVAVRKAVRRALRHATDIEDVQVELTALDLVDDGQAAQDGPPPHL